MNPRDYDMSRRAASVEETRRRIVEATVELHGERGVFGTSWRDIAERADVSVATVYKHFPSLDELVPACGDVLMERLLPPDAQSAPTVIGDGHTVRERLERVAIELFAFYERGGRHLEADFRERELEAMQEWEQHLRTTVTAFVREAFRGSEVTAAEIAVASGFFDHSTYLAFQRRGISTRRAARAVADAVNCLVTRKES